jgi:ubiquinone/menaquinone biosynthesis C-methylase UbiE
MSESPEPHRASTAERARSFGQVAAQYDEFRPALPIAVAEWLDIGPQSRVVDVAAGTGLATRTLAGTGATVISVEPDESMLAVLRTRSPGADARVGAAESLPVASKWADAVVTVSAWHWFDPPRASREFARVLKDGGFLAVIWTHTGNLDESLGQLFRMRSQLSDQQINHLIDDAAATATSRRAHRGEAIVTQVAEWFVEPVTQTFHWTWERTSSQLVGLLETYSGVITAPEGTRADLRVRARAAADALAGSTGPIAVPMVSSCLRLRQRT